MSEPMMQFRQDTLYVGLACQAHLVDGQGEHLPCDQIVADRYYATGPALGAHHGPHATNVDGVRWSWEGNAILSIRRLQHG